MSKQSRLFPSSECEEKLKDAEGKLLCDSFRYKVRAMLISTTRKKINCTRRDSERNKELCYLYSLSVFVVA